MKKFNRRDLIQRFGMTGVMLVPLLRQTRAYSAENSKRYIQLFKPLGHPDGDKNYFPTGNGRNFSFDGKLTESLEPVKDDLIVFKGIKMYKNGGNSHAEGASRIFTNIAAGSGPGTKAFDFRPPTGRSIDHMIADHLFNLNPSPMRHLNWSFGSRKQNVVHMTSFPAARQTASPVVSLTDMYNSVMGNIQLLCGNNTGNGEVIRAMQVKKSILDTNLGLIKDAKREMKLSIAESAKLDLYAEQLRVLEKSVSSLSGGGGGGECPVVDAPFGRANGERIRATFDLIALAIEWELTNVVAYQFGGGMDNEAYKDRTNTSYHGLTHPENRQAEYGRVCKYLWEHISYFLQKLKNTQTLGGESLLDAHAVLIAGGEVSDGQNHSTDNMPFMVAGKAGGYFQTGRILQASSGNKMDSHGRLLLSMCHAMGLTNMRTVGDKDKSGGGPML